MDIPATDPISGEYFPPVRWVEFQTSPDRRPETRPENKSPKRSGPGSNARPAPKRPKEDSAVPAGPDLAVGSHAVGAVGGPSRGGGQLDLAGVHAAQPAGVGVDDALGDQLRQGDLEGLHAVLLAGHHDVS